MRATRPDSAAPGPDRQERIEQIEGEQYFSNRQPLIINTFQKCYVRSRADHLRKLYGTLLIYSPNREHFCGFHF